MVVLFVVSDMSTRLGDYCCIHCYFLISTRHDDKKQGESKFLQSLLREITPTQIVLTGFTDHLVTDLLQYK